MEPEHLREDLKQEVILIICELPEAKIIDLNSRKELEYYAVRVILNQINSNTSPFAREYKNNIGAGLAGSEIIEDDSEPEEIKCREEKEKLEDKVLRIVNTTHKKDKNWYKKELLKLYMELGDYRSISKATLIPFVSCFHSITDYVSNLKDVFSDPVYTQKEAAKILNISDRAMRDLESKKIIRPEFRGQGVRLLYTKKEIERVQLMRSSRNSKKNKLVVANLKNEEINKLSPLNAKIIKLYQQFGNLRAVCNDTGLNYSACRLNLINSIKILNREPEV